MSKESEELWNRFDDLRGKTSIRVIAERLGITANALNTQRANKTMPKSEQLYIYAKYFKTTMEYLLTGEDAQTWDAPIFSKLSASQDFIDIMNALVVADKEHINAVKLVLGIQKKGISHTMVG